MAREERRSNDLKDSIKAACKGALALAQLMGANFIIYGLISKASD